MSLQVVFERLMHWLIRQSQIFHTYIELGVQLIERDADMVGSIATDTDIVVSESVTES